MTSPSTLDGVIVVPGSTSNVGEGIGRAFLKAGAIVVVPSRGKDRLTELAERIGPELATRLHGIPGGYGTFAEADELAEQIEAAHGHVVPSIGGWWMGKALWETSEAEWQQFFVETTTAHMAVARALVPRLDPDQVGQAAVLVATNPTIHDQHITLDTRADLDQLLLRMSGDAAVDQLPA